MSFIKKTKGERDSKAFSSGKNNNNISSSTPTTVFIMMVIALTLLAGCLVILSPLTPMPITTVLAQEAEGNNNTTSTTGGATTTTPGNITITAATNATTNNATAALSPSTIHLSEQPIWQESTINTGVTPFNQTHSIVTFFGNGTLTVPVTGETINVNNNGTAFVSTVTGSSIGRESFFSTKDGDRTTITFHEIMKNDPVISQTKGITMAVFDSNATGSLAPFNGMIVVGLDDKQPGAGGVATKTLWLWESGIGNNNTALASSPLSPYS
jgi:hypothetical protein